jgi:hypothetical protein
MEARPGLPQFYFLSLDFPPASSPQAARCPQRTCLQRTSRMPVGSEILAMREADPGRYAAVPETRRSLQEQHVEHWGFHGSEDSAAALGVPSAACHKALGSCDGLRRTRGLRGWVGLGVGHWAVLGLIRARAVIIEQLFPLEDFPLRHQRDPQRHLHSTPGPLPPPARQHQCCMLNRASHQALGFRSEGGGASGG